MGTSSIGVGKIDPGKHRPCVCTIREALLLLTVEPGATKLGTGNTRPGTRDHKTASELLAARAPHAECNHGVTYNLGLFRWRAKILVFT